MIKIISHSVVGAIWKLPASEQVFSQEFLERIVPYAGSPNCQKIILYQQDSLLKPSMLIKGIKGVSINLFVWIPATIAMIPMANQIYRAGISIGLYVPGDSPAYYRDPHFDIRFRFEDQLSLYRKLLIFAPVQDIFYQPALVADMDNFHELLGVHSSLVAWI